jgi:hypothetical protein
MISRALANLTDDQLRTIEVPMFETSRLDWISEINLPDVIDELRLLRVRMLDLGLMRGARLIAGTIAKMDGERAPAIIRQQLPRTPTAWREQLQHEAENLERDARIAAVQGLPFDDVIKKLKGATSMIRIKVWCEGASDRPIFRKLFRELGEDEIADTIAFIGGWPNLTSEGEPERWLHGCRQAVIIMDGDQGRKLTKRKQPLTDQAKTIERRFANYPLTLKVLRRYGIEHYLPCRAYEAVLGRDLSSYFPIPPATKIEEHFCEPKLLWPRWLNRFRRARRVRLYRKGLNQQIAEHVMFADVETSDLGDILRDIQQRAKEARKY